MIGNGGAPACKAAPEAVIGGADNGINGADTASEFDCIDAAFTDNEDVLGGGADVNWFSVIMGTELRDTVTLAT